MNIYVVLIIAARILASPMVNVLQKKLTIRGLSPEFIVMSSYLFFVLLSIPIFAITQPFDLPGEFWFYIVLLGVFDIFGNMYLVKSLKTVDLSIFGPLNSYKPVVALVFSAVLLNEIPSVLGICGVLVIIAGSYVLGLSPKSKADGIRNTYWNKGVLYRFLAILLTSVAAVFSKKAILLTSPLTTLIYWAAIGWPISIFILRKINPNWKDELSMAKGHLPELALLFLSFLALQLCTLLTFEKVFVGYSLALFQLSALISVFFGAHFFKEGSIKFRIVGAGIMTLGTILIVIYG